MLNILYRYTTHKSEKGCHLCGHGNEKRAKYCILCGYKLKH